MLYQHNAQQSSPSSTGGPGGEGLAARVNTLLIGAKYCHLKNFCLLNLSIRLQGISSDVPVAPTPPQCEQELDTTILKISTSIRCQGRLEDCSLIHG